MEYLAILLVYALERYRKLVPEVQYDNWLLTFSRFLQAGIQRLGLPVRLHPLLLIGLPCLFVAYLQYRLDHVLFGLPEFLLMVGVLFYSLGRGDFGAAVSDYLARWEVGDIQAAYHVAGEYSHYPQLEESADIAQLHRHTVEALLYQGFERWFAVVFWFALFGPWAALMYRLSCLYAESPATSTSANREFVSRFLRLVEWLPVRILAFSFSLAGNFASCYRVWREQLGRGGYSAAVLLRICAIAALGEGEELACQRPGDENRESAIRCGGEQVKSLQQLLQRSSVVWLVAMAVVIVLIDW